MIKRTLFVSNSFHISTKLNQLVLTNKQTGEEKQTTIEDVGFVVFEHEESTFTLQAIQHLTANNVAVVFCDARHLPTSMLLNLESNDIQSQLFAHQINASEPTKKQLWQQTIKSKIGNQALLFEQLDKPSELMKRCIKKVKSGDPTNEEAKASRFYWASLFDPLDFKRDRFGKPPNNLLNYGYAILRAAVARSLAGSGLLPTLGIHHHNKYNAFCLADDIMEPYRPFVDRLVVQIVKESTDYSELTTKLKARLLTVLTVDILISESTSPLMVGLSQTTASLAECFRGERKKIKYPEMVEEVQDV